MRMIAMFFVRALSWAAGEAKEKLDARAKWKEILELGKVWGRRFVLVAVGWELVEDVVFPGIAIYLGLYWLAPWFLILHFEPVVYPQFFYLFRTWDRLRGRTPWEPDRPAYSSHWRTAMKVLVHRLSTLVVLSCIASIVGVDPWVTTLYASIMTLFNFVHERIWHDSNFGIDEQDQVLFRRTLAKAFTYRVVSVIMLSAILLGTSDIFPYQLFCLYHLVMAVLYLSLESLWAKSQVGITYQAI